VLGEPTLTHRPEDGHDIPLLVWRLPDPVRAISSAVLGGGLGECRWLVNASVPMSYNRDDPAVHLATMARDLGLTGPGIGLLTGVDVADVIAETERGVRLWATVGLGTPIQAGGPAMPPTPNAPAVRSAPNAEDHGVRSAPNAEDHGVRSAPNAEDHGVRSAPNGDDHGVRSAPNGDDHAVSAAHKGGDPAMPTPSSTGDPAVPAVHHPGTVNVVVWIPARLSDAALVNAVITVTEAKTRAIRDLGLDATGTATDAVCVLCPPDGPAAAYGGPLSRWGEPLARAAYRAVLKGGEVNLAGTQSWSERQRSA
jgi:adenosylcobinamide amidohydrolase